MGADTISLSGLEKDVYENAISEGVNNSFDLKEWFKLKEADYNGGAGHGLEPSSWAERLPVLRERGFGVPGCGQPEHSKGRIKIKKIMGRIRLTEEAMEDLVSSEASFRNGMTDEKTRLIDDLARHENHALGMDGRGVIALLTATVSSATYTIDSPGNIPGANFGNRFMDVGQFYAAIDPVSGALRTSIRKVNSVSAGGTQVTFDAATFTGWADNDYLVQAANGSPSRTSSTRRSKRRSGASRRSSTTAPTATTTSAFFGVRCRRCSRT